MSEHDQPQDPAPNELGVNHSVPASAPWAARWIQPRLLLVVFFSFTALACAEQLRLLITLVSRYTNEDHALLWLAARDWSRLRMHEPTFYGQPYGVTFEAIPVAVLHALRVPYHVALPLSLLLMALSAWWLLAWGAWRSGGLLSALLAGAAPVLLATQHWVVISVIGTSVGRLLAAACAMLCLGWQVSRRNVFLAVALGGFAVAIDTSASLLSIPVLVWAAAPWRLSKRLWLPAGAGLSVPAAWLAFDAWFDGAHPDHLLHMNWPFTPELSPLLDNLHNPDRLFAIQSPELLRHGAFIPVALGCLMVLAVYARAWRELAATSSMVALLVLLSALPKSLDEASSLWFPAARMTLIVPMALWFTTSVTLRAVFAREPAVARQTFYAGLLLALVLATLTSSIARAHSWVCNLDEIRRAGLDKKALPLRSVDEIYGICRDVARAAKDFGATIAVFPNDRAANYGCAALYPELTTVFPSYERRYWVLAKLSSQVTDRMLIWGLDPKLCNKKPFRRALLECAPVVSGGAVRVRFTPRPALDELHTLGLNPRPFGPGCDPNKRETCGWWADRYGS